MYTEIFILLIESVVQRIYTPLSLSSTDTFLDTLLPSMKFESVSQVCLPKLLTPAHLITLYSPVSFGKHNNTGCTFGRFDSTENLGFLFPMEKLDGRDFFFYWDRTVYSLIQSKLLTRRFGYFCKASFV